MRKTEIKPKIIKEETRISDGIIYKYLLTESESLQVASFHLPLYSIEIEMTRGENTTKNSVIEAVSDVGKALVFFEKLVAHLATPIDLPYILEDHN